MVILPWNLYNTPVVVYFLGGLGAHLGPLFGVILALEPAFSAMAGFSWFVGAVLGLPLSACADPKRSSLSSRPSHPERVASRYRPHVQREPIAAIKSNAQLVRSTLATTAAHCSSLDELNASLGS